MRSNLDESSMPSNTDISVVGEAKIKNPIKFGRFVEEDDAVLVNISRMNVEKKARKPRNASISNPPGHAARSTMTPARPNARWSPAADSVRASTTSSVR